jgi:hypothetical protein
MNPGATMGAVNRYFHPAVRNSLRICMAHCHTCAVAANVSHRVRLCAIGSSLGRAGRGFGELRKVGNREALPA